MAANLHNVFKRIVRVWSWVDIELVCVLCNLPVTDFFGSAKCKGIVPQRFLTGTHQKRARPTGRKELIHRVPVNINHMFCMCHTDAVERYISQYVKPLKLGSLMIFMHSKSNTSPVCPYVPVLSNHISMVGLRFQSCNIQL